MSAQDGAVPGAPSRLRPMRGRDPHEPGRAASPLELLFDLTFVVAIGIAADRFAELIIAGHLGAAVPALLFALFATVWAWINFTWFASAFDTDDWAYRLVTMVQMVGVVVLALGLPAMFDSLEHGKHLDTGVMVAGYVIMRVAMVVQWLRVARQDPTHARVATAYAAWITVAQLGWIGLAVAHLPVTASLVAAPVLGALELTGPAVAERRAPTPWHAHHIAERYSLFAIIALGEVVVGTVASGSGAVGPEGTHWTWRAVTVIVAGLVATFGMWWTYFSFSFAEVLHRRRSASFWFGYGHIVTLGAIAAVGGALHLTGLYLDHPDEVGPTTVVATLAVALGAYTLSMFALFAVVVRAMDRLHVLLVALTVVVLAAAVLACAAGLALPLSVLLACLAPWITVAGYEAVGHRHQREFLAALPADEGS